MGYMKRIVGWRQERWPIPQPIQAFCGLVPFRDPEAYLEKKRAEREAAEERKAIQEEGRGSPQRHKNASPPAECVPEPESDRPQLAAAGWYRVGSTFYRIGSGPHPAFYAVRDRPTVERREPAKLQLSLFE